MMLCASAQGISFGYYTGSQKLQNWGTAKAETYSVAMLVDQPSLVGGQVTQIRVPLDPEADKLTACSAFLTRELTATSGKATGDIANVEFTPEGQWTTITLPEPYTITDEPFYVGYTLKVSATNTLDHNAMPLLLIAGNQPGGLMCVTSRTYRKWTDVGASIGGVLPIQLVIQGEVFQADAASVSRIRETSVAVGEPGTVDVLIQNHGTNDISSIDYTYEVAGLQTQGHADVSISHEYYGASAIIQVPTPAISERGEHQGTLTITHVNGQPNHSQQAVGTGLLHVVLVVPVKHPLMEEFTGTWCGFCPAGWASIKWMNEHHSDFICASYHNDDAMQITTAYPVAVDGFPMACIDRNHITDAYRGDYRQDLGIEQTWLDECNESTVANVDVQAELYQQSGVLSVHAQYQFCQDVAQANYGVAYLITADGLYGNGRNWRQHNYYSADFQNGVYNNMYIAGMDTINQGAEYMLLTFDDVVIAQSGAAGATIDGVIPTSCAEGQQFRHAYNFQTANMVSSYGKEEDRENLVQHPDRLHAIAILYNKATGHVENCNRCKVRVIDGGEIVDGIEVAQSTEPRSATQYNVMGQRVAGAFRGIVIKNGKKILSK